jgi:hypothetical protein
MPRLKLLCFLGKTRPEARLIEAVQVVAVNEAGNTDFVLCLCCCFGRRYVSAGRCFLRKRVGIHGEQEHYYSTGVEYRNTHG